VRGGVVQVLALYVSSHRGTLVLVLLLLMMMMMMKLLFPDNMLLLSRIMLVFL
jgi:hypothetical protein